MEYFETIIKALLEHEGYWVRQSFKVSLTKQEKRQVVSSESPLATKPFERSSEF